MSQPTRYWRLNYSAPADLERMLAGGTILVPSGGLSSAKYDAGDCVSRRMKKGDGIFLGKLDLDTGRALIEAVGIIEDQNPATRVRWKRVSKTVFPNPQGGFPPWQDQCFLFNGQRAEVYNLATEFQVHFPDA
jgi:hypothetical protein